MSDENRKPGKIVTYGLVVLALGMAILLFQRFDLHGTRLPPTARVDRGNDQRTDIPAADLLETLRKDPGYVGCRNLLAQLNRQPATSSTWSAAEGEALRKEFHLDEGDFAELNSSVYTPLDAHYLDQCFLLHDAARSLGVDDLPARDRAVAVFGWVMRQVRLQVTDGSASPPAFVLRRGWGTDRERSLVFLALLDQLGIPGCMIALPEGSAFRFRLAGGLCDGNIYVFDSLLGVPIAGPSGRGLATLAQVKTQADLLKPPCDVDFAQTRQAEPYIACPLSALSPRMRRLEARLPEENRPHLAVVPAALLKTFGNALRQPGLAECPVRFWGPAFLQVLRNFFSPDEGGNDRSTDGVWRRARFNHSLTPWQLMPTSVQQLPEESDLGFRLRQAFAGPLLDMAYHPRMPHELLLRGRLDDAVAGLVEIRGSVGRLRESVRAEPNPNQVLEQWLKEARRAYAELLRAQREASGKDSAALKTAQERMSRVWEPEQAKKPIDILQAAAAEPRLAQATYYLALAKHEMAERVRNSRQPRAEELKAAWRAAADWWRKYLDDYPSDPAAASARLNLARALAEQGEREAALQLLQEPPAHFHPWEKRACAIRANQLREQK